MMHGISVLVVIVLSVYSYLLLRKLQQKDMQQQETYANLSAVTHQLHLCIEHSTDAILTCTADNIITSCNKATEQIFGYRLHELIGSRLDRLFPAADSTQHAIDGWHKSGSPLQLSVEQGVSRYKPDQHFTYFIRDLTPWLEIEQMLEKNQELLDLLHKSSHDGICDVNMQTGEVWLSPRWKEMLGYKDCELVNSRKTLRELMLTEDYESSCKLADNHIRYNIPYHAVFRFYHKDGSIRHMLSRGHMAKGVYGEPLRMVSTHTDITELIVMQEQLAETTRQLELFTHQLPIVACQLTTTPSHHYRIRYISEQVHALCGISPETVYADNESLFASVIQEDRANLTLALQQAIATWSSWSCQYRMYRNGSLRWLHAQFTLAQQVGEETASWNGIITDITDISAFKQPEPYYPLAFGDGMPKARMACCSMEEIAGA